MGELKELIMDWVKKHSKKVADISVIRVVKSGNGAKIHLPKFMLGALARRIYIDDDDEIIVVLLVHKSELNLPPNVNIKKMLKRTIQSVDPEVAESPERSRMWMRMVEEEKKRGD